MEHASPQFFPSIFVLAGLCLAIVLVGRLLWRNRSAAAALALTLLVGMAVVASYVTARQVAVIRVDGLGAVDVRSDRPTPMLNLQSGTSPAIAAADHGEIPLQPAVGGEPATETAEAPPAEPRPSWLGKPGRLVGRNYEVAVKSGPYVTVAECQRALESAEARTVADYLESYLGDGAGQLVDVGDEYLRDHLQREQFLETVHASIGSMQQMHALLVFDDDARRDFHDRWRAAMVRQRLWLVGSGGTLVLLVLGSAFGYLVASGRRAEPTDAPR